jgi:hypothetical protein
MAKVVPWFFHPKKLFDFPITIHKNSTAWTLRDGSGRVVDLQALDGAALNRIMRKLTNSMKKKGRL